MSEPESMAERFATSGGEPVDVDGRRVHFAYVLGPVPTGVMTVRMQPSGDLEQGVGISTEDGWLTVAGQKAKMCALWTATAPERVDVTLRPLRGRREMHVRLWNVWKLAKWGSTMGGVGNFGLLVESTEAHAAILRCSAGPGPLRFDDLVIELDFVPDAS